MILLIRERLDRCGVEATLTFIEGHGQSVLGNDSFPRASGRSNEHRFSGVKGIKGLHLKRIRGELVTRQASLAGSAGHSTADLRRRHKMSAPIPTAMTYKTVSGTPSAISVMGSPLGVITAATIKITMMA